jgi:hypothetical protein
MAIRKSLVLFLGEVAEIAGTFGIWPEGDRPGSSGGRARGSRRLWRSVRGDADGRAGEAGYIGFLSMVAS